MWSPSGKPVVGITLIQMDFGSVGCALGTGGCIGRWCGRLRGNGWRRNKLLEVRIGHAARSRCNQKHGVFHNMIGTLRLVRGRSEPRCCLNQIGGLWGIIDWLPGSVRPSIDRYGVDAAVPGCPENGVESRFAIDQICLGALDEDRRTASRTSRIRP
jgi:hypothetical protein